MARWWLLGAVIAGVLTLHVLTAEHPPGQHGGVGPLFAAGPSLVLLHAGHSLELSQGVSSDLVGEQPAAAGSMAGTFEHPAGSGPSLLGCVLVLVVVVGPVVLMALLRGRRAVGCTPEASHVPVRALLVLATPARTRLTLCVIRT